MRLCWGKVERFFSQFLIFSTNLSITNIDFFISSGCLRYNKHNENINNYEYFTRKVRTHFLERNVCPLIYSKNKNPNFFTSYTLRSIFRKFSRVFLCVASVINFFCNKKYKSYNIFYTKRKLTIHYYFFLNLFAAVFCIIELESKI